MAALSGKLLLFLLLLNLTVSSPIQHHSLSETVDVNLVRYFDHPRVRRDIGESTMPDVIVKNLTYRGDNVILNLRRVREIPVTMAGQDKDADHTGDLNSGVYVDPARTGAFIVKRSGDDFLLHGHLRHKEQPLTVAPSVVGSSSGLHAPHDVSILRERIRFGHDAVPLTQLPIQAVLPGDVLGKRRKRQAVGTTVHTIEPVFIIDFTDYTRWRERFPDQTVARIRQFYTYTALTVSSSHLDRKVKVRNIFSSVNEVNRAIDIKFKVKQLYIVGSADNSFSTSVGVATDGPTYLAALKAWIPSQASQGLGQGADHYMAFTQIDVKLDGEEAVGVATRDGICTDSSLSVVENAFSPSVAVIAAHELGHSLGAGHDGLPGRGCSDFRSQFVMTPTFIVPPQYQQARPEHLYDFSPCSVDAFLARLNRVSCTLPAETSGRDALPPIPRGTIITDRDEQCRYIRDDETSEYCDLGVPLSEICSGMTCKIPSNDPRRINCTFVLPFEGTPCGDGMVCSQGVCVSESTVSAKVAVGSTGDMPATAPAPAPSSPASATPAQAPATPATPAPAPATPAPAPAPAPPSPTSVPTSGADTPTGRQGLTVDVNLPNVDVALPTVDVPLPSVLFAAPPRLLSPAGRARPSWCHNRFIFNCLRRLTLLGLSIPSCSICLGFII